MLKLKVYMEIMGICFFVAFLYLCLLGCFLGMTKPIYGAMLAINLWFLVNHNDLFQYLIDKWGSK